MKFYYGLTCMWLCLILLGVGLVLGVCWVNADTQPISNYQVDPGFYIEADTLWSVTSMDTDWTVATGGTAVATINANFTTLTLPSGAVDIVITFAEPGDWLEWRSMSSIQFNGSADTGFYNDNGIIRFCLGGITVAGYSQTVEELRTLLDSSSALDTDSSMQRPKVPP